MIWAVRCPVPSLFFEPLGTPTCNSFSTLSTLDVTREEKIPGSPRLHNFSVCIPECGSLGLGGMATQVVVFIHSTTLCRYTENQFHLNKVYD